jgi:signal transduction histidine kinase
MLARASTSESQQDAIYSVALGIEAAIGRLRRLLFELNPPGLAASTLGEALQAYMLEFAAEAPIEWTVDDDLTGQPAEELKQVLFRVAQEALRNVRKHADAKRVDVRLSECDGGILLQIRDDGVGFAPHEAWRVRAGHIGMPSMRERMERVGGWLETRSRPGAGAVIEAWLPHLDRPQTQTAALDEASATSLETNGPHVR